MGCTTATQLALTLFATMAVLRGEFTDLENFIRVLGSLNTNTSAVNYLNGSVYLRQPGAPIVKIFNYEGYNINRKQRRPDGTFLSLSREFVVYRQPNTSQIMQVWMNPISGRPNEVFTVMNDPVNAHLSDPSPNFAAPYNRPAYRIYNSDIVLEYRNPLQPDAYPRYSAGPWYDSVELFGFFANYTLLTGSSLDSLPMTGTWMRKSEFLPWMELGTTPGELYYTTLAWKCMDGLACVAEDIMNIIKENYPKYLKAPSTEEVPNETSWTVFKKVIDQRRQAGLPDIIIPQVNTSTHVRDMVYDVDPRVLNVLYKWPLNIRFNGTAWSEIPGKQTVPLYNLRGNVGVDLEPIPEGGGWRLQLDGNFYLLNHTTNEPFKQFLNPITGRVNNVTYIQEVAVDMVFPKDSFYSMDIYSSEVVGLIGAQGMDDGAPGGTGNWSVNMFNAIFPWEELAKNTTVTTATFYGIFSTFASWPVWMEMTDIPGNIVQKLFFSNGDI
ncbi:uncharacterized protein LOC128220427 [Mya arenaria]|uniref:uncharacterized protein LOC128220427 n=1 Tax=Mya arenaria TaxID=6604 RepID=UPI0022E8E441|nr:uncharacterized protein LOC128220427 [Mya arenaria]